MVVAAECITEPKFAKESSACNLRIELPKFRYALAALVKRYRREFRKKYPQHYKPSDLICETRDSVCQKCLAENQYSGKNLDRTENKPAFKICKSDCQRSGYAVTVAVY